MLTSATIPQTLLSETQPTRWCESTQSDVRLGNLRRKNLQVVPLSFREHLQTLHAVRHWAFLAPMRICLILTFLQVGTAQAAHCAQPVARQRAIA